MKKFLVLIIFSIIMINLTKQQSIKYYGMMLNSWRTVETVQSKKIYPVLNNQWDYIANDILDGDYDIDQAVKEYTPELRKVIGANYTQSISIYNDFALKMLDLKCGIVQDIKDSDTIFWTYMNAWLMSETAKQISLINSTTKLAIQTVIANGIREGLSNNEIAKNLQLAGNISSKSRSVTIARTEVHTAYSKSTNETIISTSTKVKTKDWMSAGDKRVRDPHNIANGQRVAFDDYFIVFGEKLEYPGDSRGSAKNVVNCRCMALYNT